MSIGNIKVQKDTLFFDYYKSGVDVVYEVETSLASGEWISRITTNNGTDLKSEKSVLGIKNSLLAELTDIESNLFEKSRVLDTSKRVEYLSDMNRIRDSIYKEFVNAVALVDCFMNDVHNFTKLEFYILVIRSRTMSLKIYDLLYESVAVTTVMAKNINHIKSILDRISNISFDEKIDSLIKLKATPMKAEAQKIKGVWLSYNYIMKNIKSDKLKTDIHNMTIRKFHNTIRNIEETESNGLRGDWIDDSEKYSSRFKIKARIGQQNGRKFTDVIFGMNIRGIGFKKIDIAGKFSSSFDDREIYDIYTFSTMDRWLDQGISECEVYILSKYISFKATDNKSTYALAYKLVG